jgi:hypothetical protein
MFKVLAAIAMVVLDGQQPSWECFMMVVYINCKGFSATRVCTYSSSTYPSENIISSAFS